MLFDNQQKHNKDVSCCISKYQLGILGKNVIKSGVSMSEVSLLFTHNTTII